MVGTLGSRAVTVNLRLCGWWPIAVHEDLVERNFTAEAPNQLWLADITESPV
jgi:hypothetical protein